MTPNLIALALIGALVALGLLVGVGLVLLTTLRERREFGLTGDETTPSTDRDRAA